MIPPWRPPPPDGPATDPRGVRLAAHAASTPRSASTANAADDLVIRPFMLTGGRTRPVQDGLRVETLVLAAPAALSAPLRFEARRIVELCQQPTALADVAVALGVPVGVARVLVSDLVIDGSLQVVEQRELSVEMIERIRDRVRSL
jgi:hypothetical protein